MNKFGSFFKPLMWFMASMLAAFVAGCGGGDGGGSLPVPPGGQTAAGVVCATTGAEPCVNLATAGDFVILGDTAITNVPTSAITGNVGLEAGASITGLTCPEVSLGRVFDSDAGFADAACLTTDGTRLTVALTDIGLAFIDAAGRASSGAPPPGAIAPGVYTLPNITIATDVTLDGPASGVWIIQTPGNMSLTTGNVLLTGGALPQNVFWRVAGNVAIGSGLQLPGIVMADGTIDLAGNSTVNGRLYSASDITLSAGANTVTRP